ncbi:MAG: hypothetical protein Q4B48_01405 [Syntrophomonadaceae bacterium]|nr:hypothetical protein [Syntrophomonadaceae bacterium]
MRDGKHVVAWCPICSQGWVYIVKDKATHELFLCCEECESEWESPEAVKSIELSTQWEYGYTIEPEDEEIAQIGWDKHLMKW